MKRSRFSEEQIIAVLKEAEATSVKGACAKYNLSEATLPNLYLSLFVSLLMLTRTKIYGE